MSAPELVPAPNLSYFTPFQEIPAGTATDQSLAPSLFKPFKLRGVEFQNKIWLSPMCQYSADKGHLTDWHLAHLGGILTRGPSLTIVEATAVLPEGRISPQDSGLWQDSQIAPLKRIVDFAHSQNQKIGIQLAHAGRKASMNAQWLHFTGPPLATKDVGGWPDDVYGPSDVPFAEAFAKPKALTKEGIERVKQAFIDAARRAVTAGVDVIEIHGGTGYLLSSFNSPTSNKRTDEYGGSFENRTRLTVEVFEALRSTIPSHIPIMLRISGTEGLEHLPDVESWRIEDTVRLAKILADKGLDLLDVTSGFNDPRQRWSEAPGYQVHLAEAVKKALGPDTTMLISTVGVITSGLQAQTILDRRQADVIMVGRQFQKDPGTVWQWADELGIDVRAANQIGWGWIFKARVNQEAEQKKIKHILKPEED